MRHLASHEGNVLNSRHSHIGDEHAMAEKVAGILLAQQARTDPTVGGRVGSHV
jgi:glycine cleavage system regulatory protein